MLGTIKREERVAIPGGSIPRGEAELGSELLWIVQAVRARWKLILVLTALLVASAVAIAGSIVPFYAASATILIDRGQTEYTDLRSAPGTRQDVVLPTEMESYIKVLWSDQLARDVVRSVGLRAARAKADPLRRFLNHTKHQGLTLLSRLVDFAETALGLRLPPGWKSGLAVANPVVRQHSDAEQQAVELFRERLSVERDPLAFTLGITYRDADPAVAERVANTTADAFPKELVRAQQSALMATSEYLGERVVVLRDELSAADREIEALQTKASRADGPAIAKLHLADITRVLSEAEGEIASLRIDMAEAGYADSQQPINDRLASRALQSLRLDDLKFARDIAQLGADVGDRHPEMQAILANRAGVRASIKAEEARIRGQLQRSLHAAEAKAAWLRQRLGTTEETLAQGMDDEVKLRQLQTSTDSTKQVYQDILSRYQRASEEQRMVRPPARVINIAQRPSQPDRRPIRLALLAAAFGALSASVALALALELRRKGFRSSDELTRATGLLSFGSLPFIASGFGDGYGRASETQRWVYAEAVRRLALHVVPPGTRSDGNGTVVLVTSAMPAEGKSVASLSLARQLAESGHRVLLVDADLHKGTLERLTGLATAPEAGLAHLLRSWAGSLDAAVVRDTRTNLKILPAGTPAEDPSKLLASGVFAEILREARAHYDAVIVDAPPVLSTADSNVIACLADCLLLVVRWQSTPREAVQLALRELRVLASCQIGLVLNMVKLSTYPRWGSTDQLAYHRLGAGYRRRVVG